MSKARDTKKDGKKKPSKSLKEKREEKKQKKAGKVFPLQDQRNCNAFSPKASGGSGTST